MKNSIRYLFVFALCSFVNAQDLLQKIPLDPNMTKGVLANGMTYYLYPTDVEKDVASFYIIQNVGSVLENDDQQGLAHFLEHMAFNGTASFPGKTLLKTLEKHGLSFGGDINAYTSFDETVYRINRIPNTPELMDLGLNILHDWSNYITLDEEEIDAERGVVREEKRSRDGGGIRIGAQLLKTQYGYSKYADRLPIGKMEIIDNFEYKTLRDFYHNWYRTDLQAIAIVGDIDVEDMERKIKSKFAQIPAVEDRSERYEVYIENNEKMIFDTASDPEVTSSGINFGIRYDRPKEKNTVGYLRYTLLNRIVILSLKRRYSQLQQESEVPFTRIGAKLGKFLRNYDGLSLSVNPKPSQQQESFETLMNEVNRAVKFGFTNSEIKLAKNQIKKEYRDYVKNIENRYHGGISIIIKDDYLENEQFSDPVKVSELAEEILNGIKNEDVHKRIKQLYTDVNRSLTITGVAGENNLTKKQALKIIERAEKNEALAPYEEAEIPTSLVDASKLVSGKIISETENEELDFTTFRLSNGITVHYKFVDKQKNRFNFNAYSHGGKSIIPLSDRPSAESINSVAKYSGLGDFSATELKRFLADKSAGSSIGIREIGEVVTGWIKSPEDLETLMQLVNQRFTYPRLNKKGFDLMMRDMHKRLQDKKKVRRILYDSLNVAIYGKDHPVVRPLDREFLKTVNLEKMQKIYQERFGNPADFTFYAIGDISKYTLKPLLEKYIASMPTNNSREYFRDTTDDWKWAAKKIDKVIPLKMENPQGTVRIQMKKEIPYTRKDELLVSMLVSILQLRYTESLREDEGGTYGVHVYGNLERLPRPVARIHIDFDCNPQLTDTLVALVYEELEKLKKGIIADKDLVTVKTNFLKGGEDGKNYNGYYLQLVKDYITRDGLNLSLPENFEDIIESVTANDIKNIANKIMEGNDSYKIVFVPKEKGL